MHSKIKYFLKSASILFFNNHSKHGKLIVFIPEIIVQAVWSGNAFKRIFLFYNIAMCLQFLNSLLLFDSLLHIPDTLGWLSFTVEKHTREKWRERENTIYFLKWMWILGGVSVATGTQWPSLISPAGHSVEIICHILPKMILLYSGWAEILIQWI